MKQLVAYLLEHKALGVLAVVIAVLTGGAYAFADGLKLNGGAPPAASASATPEEGFFIYAGGDTGTHETDAGDGQLDIIVGAGAGPPAITPGGDDLIVGGSTAFFQVLGQYCRADIPYVNVELDFREHPDLLFNKDAIPAMFQDAACSVQDLDEEALTALVTCTGQPGTQAALILPFIDQEPLYIPIGECGDSRTADESSAPPPREREPDCQDRKC